MKFPYLTLPLIISNCLAADNSRKSTLSPKANFKASEATSNILENYLYHDWKVAAPRKISDPEDKKPEDWVDEPDIEDPEDTKPEDWIEDLPKKIKDLEAKKPEWWDDTLDGFWEAPLIDNPNYRPKWMPRLIKNPAYKGPWLARRIDNPEFKEIPNINDFKDNGQVAVDLASVVWSHFCDSILLTDDAK